MACLAASAEPLATRSLARATRQAMPTLPTIHVGSTSSRAIMRCRALVQPLQVVGKRVQLIDMVGRGVPRESDQQKPPWGFGGPHEESVTPFLRKKGRPRNPGTKGPALML